MKSVEANNKILYKDDNILRLTTSSFYNFVSCSTVGFITALLLGLWFDSIFVATIEFAGTLFVAALAIKLDRHSVYGVLITKIIGILFVLILYYGNLDTYGLPYFRGGSDDLNIELMAHNFISLHFDWPWESTFYSNLNGMYWLVSLFIKLGNQLDGYNTVSFRLFNINLHIMCGELLYFIYYSYSKNMVSSRKLLYFYMLFPNSLYISSFVFRDTLAVFLLLLAYFISENLFRKDNLSLFIFAKRKLLLVFVLSFIIIFSYYLRIELFIFILFVMAISAIYTRSSLKFNIATILKFAILLLIFFAILWQAGLLEYVIQKLERYQDYRTSQLTTVSNAFYQTIFRLPLFPFGFILRAVFGLLSPLPTNIIRLNSIFNNGVDFVLYFVALGTCIQIVFLPVLFSGLKKFNKVVIIFIAIFCSIILTTFTFRHFLMLYPFMFMIIMSELDFLEYSKKKHLISLGILMIAVFGLLYVGISV